MPGPTVLVRILGDLTKLSASFKDAQTKGASAAKGLHDAFSGTLAALNKTGVLGPFGEALSGIDQALDTVGKHAKDIGPMLMGVGGALAGVGVGLSALGSKDQAAHQQLQASVEATGKSYDDYEGKIESAIKTQEKFGHAANDTQDALRVLTQATGDPAKALQYLSTASDLAAAKHESLTAAATTLGRVYNGATKSLKEFGIEAAPKAAAATKALETATKGAANADDAAAKAKQSLVDLQARLSASNHAAVVSTAGVTAAQDRLAAAQQHLADLQAIDASKGKLTVSQQIALRNAHDAVTKATNGVAVAQQKYQTAQDKAAHSAGLSVAQQQQLRNAEDKVTDTAAKAKDAHNKLAAAHATADKAAHGQTDTMTALSNKLKGQASAAADTFGGKINAIKAHMEDVAATIGTKYGPAITGAGTVMAGLGGAITTTQGIMSTFTKASKDTEAAVKDVKGAEEGAQAASSLLAGASGIGLVLLAVAALIAIGYLLYKNWDTIWGGIKRIVADVWNWIKANWPLLLGILLGPIALAAALIYKYWGQISDGFKVALAAIKTAWNTFVGWLSGLAGSIARIASGMWHGVADAFGTALGAIQTAWGTFWGWFTGLPGGIARAASGMWHGITDAFHGAINAAIDIWNRLHFKLPAINWGPIHLGGSTIGVPYIPHLAQGGLVTQTGLIYAHAGEAITPMPKGRLGPAVNVEHAHFSSEIDIETFMRKAAWVVQAKRI